MAPQPGKTAPRLLQDLLTYDPRYEDRAGRNLLTTAPPHYEPGAPPTAAVPFRNCRHSLLAKSEQSQLPRPGEDADHTTVYKIASFCSKCRWHIDLIVDFRDDGPKNVPCHTSYLTQPLHHFLYQHEDGSYSHDAFGSPNVARNYKFACSASKCPVELRIRMSPPHFSDRDIVILTDRINLRRRWEAAKEHAGDRTDAAMARSVDAPDYLNTYLSDSLNPSKGKSRIPFLNRKFLKTFGQDCDDILKRLGFTDAEEEEDDGSLIRVWYLPRPPPPGHPLETTERNVIEDARYELNLLINDFPENERTGIRHAPVLPHSSLHDIERALGCLNYEKVKGRTETRSTNHEEDHPYYAGLGAVGDFSDRLLLFAYRRQSDVDDANASYYFECLQDLAVGRRSSELETEVAVLASKGFVNRREVASAYKFFGIDPRHANSINDDHIIGTFKSRLPDISQAMVEEARKQLRLIGFARNSERIKQEASDAIETYEQALSWLDLDHSHPDDFVTTMCTLKIGDNASSIETARKAVSIIAEKRNSKRLRDFLEKGTISDAEMDGGEAYALLGITNRSEPIDIDVLQVQVGVFQEGNPESAEKYQQAFEIVHRDQQELRGASGQGTSRNKHPLDTWPVGFMNIGNTCYLNSVLQFLFTIKPLREMILDCDRYMQEATPEALQSKRVGRSAVTLERVEKAQRFVSELRKLFEHMIKAPTDVVRPEMDLAALALTKESPVESKQPESKESAQPALSEITGTAASVPKSSPNGVDSKLVSRANSITDEIGRNASRPDVDTSNDGDARSDTSTTPMDLSDSVNEQVTTAANRPEPPSRPPPVPPRPQPQVNPTMKDLEFSARQQDAAEVMNNIFDLLSCAIKGDAVMGDGEQHDLIKSLFFSDITTVRETNGKRAEKSDIQDNIHISTKTRDRPLFAALDDEFTLDQLDDGSAKFEFIANASPIQVINVRRLQYVDGRSVKDQSHVGLDPVLYFDRYLKETKSLSPDQLEARRNKQWERQRKLQELEARRKTLSETDIKDMDLASVLETSAEFVRDLEGGVEEKPSDAEGELLPPDCADLAKNMSDRSNDIRKQIEDLNEPMKQVEEEINSVFTDCKDHPYRLHAVFMHRGGAHGGHYWIYIHDFEQGIWRKYNDEQVDEVEEKDVFKRDTEEPPATSTGIVFIRDDQVKDLTEAVCRLPSTLDNDVQMLDADGDPPPLVSMDVAGTQYTDVQVLDGVEKENEEEPVIDIVLSPEPSEAGDKAV